MRLTPALVAVPLTLAFALSACGGDDDPVVAVDPGSEPSSAAPADPGAVPPTSVPAAPGEVRTRTLVTVIDTGSGPEVCLGAVAESYPPQCGGPAVEGWDWADEGDMAEKQGRVRWGSFALTGTWDGTALSVSDVIAGALYDPAPEEAVAPPSPEVRLSDAELQDIAEKVADLPGATGSGYVDGGHVLVDVTYDDGSLQDYADATYGAGVVVVSGQLVDAG